MQETPTRESRREERLNLLAKCLYVGAAVGLGTAVAGTFFYLVCDAYLSQGLSLGACMAYAGVLSVVFSRVTVVTGVVGGATAGLAAYAIRRILRHEPAGG